MVHVHGRRRVGATMPPEGKDNLKGQACLGCKRNGMLCIDCLILQPLSLSATKKDVRNRQDYA